MPRSSLCGWQPVRTCPSALSLGQMHFWLCPHWWLHFPLCGGWKAGIYLHRAIGLQQTCAASKLQHCLCEGPGTQLQQQNPCLACNPFAGPLSSTELVWLWCKQQVKLKQPLILATAAVGAVWATAYFGFMRGRRSRYGQ